MGRSIHRKPTTKQIYIRIPDRIIEKLDRHIDKIEYRSRAHLVTVILSDWLKEKGKEKQNNVKKT